MRSALFSIRHGASLCTDEVHSFFRTRGVFEFFSLWQLVFGINFSVVFQQCVMRHILIFHQHKVKAHIHTSAIIWIANECVRTNLWKHANEQLFALYYRVRTSFTATLSILKASKFYGNTSRGVACRRIYCTKLQRRKISYKTLSCGASTTP